MNVYPLNTLVQLQATFAASNGTLVDPTSVSVSIKTPDGEINAYDPTRVSTGVYTYQVLTDQWGPWIYDWSGTGAVQATSGDVYFLVASSSVLPDC